MISPTTAWGLWAAWQAGLYLWGRITHDDHKSETGVLAGEAALNSLVAVYALKYTFGRERPLQDDFRGDFRSGGDGFPSEHAAAAWSVASVIRARVSRPRHRDYGLWPSLRCQRVASYRQAAFSPPMF